MRTVRLLIVSRSAWGGDVCLGGVCLEGVSAQKGCVPKGMLGYTHPQTEFLTHACENITFLQLPLPLQ